MSEFEDKLNAILSDPNAMAQVANLAQSLNLGGIFGEDNTAAEESPALSHTPVPAPQSGGGNPLMGGLGDLAGLGDLLGQIDPAMIARLLPLVRELTGPGVNDERMALLMALRPFLKPERRDKVERAVKAARLLHVGKQFLTTMGESNV